MLEGRPITDSASLTALSRTRWATATFTGEIVIAESATDFDANQIQGSETFDGLLVADLVVLTPRSVRMRLIDAGRAREACDA